jgi:hypothetical protein
MSESKYPKRPQYFACKFVRLLTKKCVANDLGPQVFTLLCVVVHQEDARGYTDSVGWYNSQLMPVAGLNSVDVLDRVRRKAIEAGWLHYTPGGKNTPGRYFVTIPECYQDTDDLPTDEGNDGALFRSDAEVTAEQSGDDSGSVRTGADRTRRQPRKEPEGNRGTLIPAPAPVPNTPQTPAHAGVASTPPDPNRTEAKTPSKQRRFPGSDPLFVQFYDAYPLKQDRPAAWRAWQKLKPDKSLAAQIMAGLSKYKANKPDWQQWKQPGPWLNARRWEDEPPSAKPPPVVPVVKRPTDNPLLRADRLQQNAPPME